MLQPTYPGIYTQELESGVRTISGAPTSTGFFIGPTGSGIDLRPIRIRNFGDFERQFGGLSRTSSLSYSVMHFFSNGGGDAYVMRVPAKGSKAAVTQVRQDGVASASVTLTALGSGEAGSAIMVTFDDFGIGANPLGSASDEQKKLFNLSLVHLETGVTEFFGNLSTSSTSARYAPGIVNDPATGSKLVSLAMNAIDSPAPKTNGSIYETKGLTTGNFPADSKINISVSSPKADGSGADAAFSFSDKEVIVAKSGSERPTSKLGMANMLKSAINQAVRDDTVIAEKMKGHAIEVRLLEEGAALHVYTTLGEGTNAGRLSEAKVTLSSPAAGVNFFNDYVNATVSEISSRYRLGKADTTSGQIVATNLVAGENGDASGQPETTDIKDAVSGLMERDPFFNLLCLPDLVRPSASDPRASHHASASAVYNEAALLCRKHHAFLLVDPPPNAFDLGSAEAWKNGGFQFQSTHSAAFFPNLRVDDPLVPGSILSHPPSGAIAGVIARTDSRFGFWTAPAGTAAVINGTYGASVELSDADQGVLNPIALNCIRKFPVYGTVNFGSRTVDGSNAMASEWKYIPVRRTASYILRSLSEGLRWAIHKPNGEDLWGQLRLSCTAFMQGLFRKGAFKGVSPKEAFFVQCDASTTSPTDLDQGIVNIVIGFAPLKVAEFVVISLRQKTAQSE